MCGFVVTNTNTKTATLTAAVAHRGTFKPEVVKRFGYQFVHALMPVQGGKPTLQPIVGNRHIMVFQGELWEHGGHPSDTEYMFGELMRAATKPDGNMAATVNKLEGMFAFVFADQTTIWFATDVFGEQPIYHHHAQGGMFPKLTVASEMKQLRACGIPLQRIKPAKPGMLYKYDMATGTLTETPYHAFNYDGPRTTEVDHSHIRGLLAASCKRKYEAVALQRPALLLSGGVDSAIMAYELSKLGLDRAFTVAIDPESTDFKTAEVTAARFGLELTKVQAVTLEPDLAIAMSESKNRSVVEEYVCHLALAKCLAEQDYRVVFTGSGADELFCGYPYYLRFTSRKDPSSLARMQEKLVQAYHSRELRILNKVYMSKAIECRSPFLDRELCSYATTLDINECMVAGGRMKAALRDAYADKIDSAQNEKIIAGRSMGVIDYFANLNGGMDARVYHARHREIFTDNDLLLRLLRELERVDYKVL